VARTRFVEGDCGAAAATRELSTHATVSWPPAPVALLGAPAQASLTAVLAVAGSLCPGLAQRLWPYLAEEAAAP